MPFLAVLTRIPLLAYLSGALFIGLLYNRHGWNAEKKERLLEHAQAIEATNKANLNAAAAAELYEEEKGKQHTRTIYVFQKGKKALADSNGWDKSAIPPSVRDAASAAATLIDPGVAKEPVREAGHVNP